MLYIGKFGLENFILVGDSKWILLLNIGIWYVLVMFCMREFIHSLNDKPSIVPKEPTKRRRTTRRRIMR